MEVEKDIYIMDVITLQIVGGYERREKRNEEPVYVEVYLVSVDNLLVCK